MKKIAGMWVGLFVLLQATFAQVDTTYIYRTNAPYGTLDIRIAKSATRYYYLQENRTFSFRESSPGVRTNTFRDMTSWDSNPYTQGNLRERNGTQDLFMLNYRLLFPSNYNANYSPGYPLILMMHGAGERANCWFDNCYWGTRSYNPLTNSPAAPTTSTHQLLNNDHNLLHGGSVHLSARNLAGARLPNDPGMPTRAFPGFVLFPQNLNGWTVNQVQDVIRLVRLVAKKYNIDENRIYIHGLSNGGYGVWEAVKRAPWLFATMLTMSATSDANVTTNPAIVDDMRHINMWLFQGGQDQDPTPARTRGIVKRFTDQGGIVRYTEYPNLGHGTWNTAYNEPDFFTYILSKNKSRIHVYANTSTICLTTGQGVRLELAKGFRAYQWQKDGVTIPGATGPLYTATEAGTYRARFSRVPNPSESDWNIWSQDVFVTESNPEQAKFTVQGTTHLRDLNNYGNARLHAVGDFAHYYWYKDGTIVNLPGNLDDTTKHPIMTQGTCTNLPTCTGNGVYTLVTAGFDNCPSPPSEGVRLWFNNQAPINITAPTTFTGASNAPGKVNLQWGDASNNEQAFEIWRRRVITATTFTAWAMAPLAPENTNSYLDVGLDPAATYQYKIRAISSGGRSNNTPSASNQFLTVTTQGDPGDPTTPANLVAEATGIREITLHWDASTDEETSIRQYRINYNGNTLLTPNASTTYRFTNLALNTVFDFTVSALDLGNNESPASAPATANTYLNGLYYEHSTGAWTDLDQINWNSAEFRGTVPTITLEPRTQEDFFNFEFDGYLYIDVAGTYQFRTTSDDGSRLTLNNVVIVDNDGTHGDRTITSTNQSLSSGPHVANVKYFENSSGQSLTVQYRGPDTGNNWQTIPESAWRSGTPPDEETFAITETSGGRMSVYPNPAEQNTSLNVMADGDIGSQPVHISVINMMGETFYQKTVQSDELAAGTSIVPDKPLLKGVYILVIRRGNDTTKERLIIE